MTQKKYAVNGTTISPGCTACLHWWNSETLYN